MEKLLFILITISITSACFASGPDNDGGFDPTSGSLGDEAICVHLNVETNIAEKYAFVDRHNACPPFDSANAYPLNNFELLNVRYDILPQTNFAPFPLPTLVNVSKKFGAINWILIPPSNNSVHANDHSCKMGRIN